MIRKLGHFIVNTAYNVFLAYIKTSMPFIHNLFFYIRCGLKKIIPEDFLFTLSCNI